MNVKTLHLTVASLLFVCAACLSPASVMACRAPRPSPRAVVSGAEVIVRATAVRYAKAPRGNIRELHEPVGAEIEFRVEEVLKGEGVPEAINLNGYLTDEDDFNDRPVPYDFVRPRGRGGWCSAYEYKRGAEFLLFLKSVEGKLKISWYALAPTNEQLRSADDPWIIWVREQLEASEGEEPSVGVGVYKAFDIWALRFPLSGAV